MKRIVLLVAFITTTLIQAQNTILFIFYLFN